jgi:hypothetical protein
MRRNASTVPQIRYLNTDLEIVSDADIRPLVEAFEARGVHSLYLGETEAGWRATLETYDEGGTPETTILALLTAVKALPIPMRKVWAACRKREFDIGYDCGDEPWAFNQALSPNVVVRVASVGAGIRITLYPHRE